MNIACPVCHGSDKAILVEGRLNIYSCGSCRHTFTDLAETRREVYDEDYFLKTHKVWFNNPNYGLFDFIYKKILKLSRQKRLRLLDVGCGKGDFLKYIACKQLNAELFGVDLIANQYPGVQFIKGDIYDLENPGPGAKFDVISSLAVIEHVGNPNLFIQRLNNLLETGGLLFIMTVNNNSLIYRLARLLNKAGIRVAHDRLYSFHHLQHYTNQSLKRLMETNGFSVLLNINHNYPMKAVDVPEGSFLVMKMYKFCVRLIFLLSVPFRCGIYQTMICKKR